ncbi:MAG TPA: glycosyltransferase [Chloroflexota bacterium]|nr:glycosyltransferase [Chloroflexota bacterium]
MRHIIGRRLARIAVILAIIYVIYYLGWRLFTTFEPRAPLFFAVFLTAEIYGVLSLLLFVFMTWDLKHTPPPPPPMGLSVDVFIPTFNEALDIIEATLVGCQRMTYPHTTYVLDDGKRPEVARLAERLGCRYLTRPDRRHAKAGNLNAALARTQGEFIVVLDADTVPQPDLLERTLGYFTDPRVAFVQLPQEFYNLDSIQHRSGADGALWHEQGLFYRVIQPGKNRWNAAFWCGSPSILRRAALASIGGVATGTITEDLHTSLRLHAAGWKSVYHPEPLAYGIAPQTLLAFTIQRLRWAQGAMQLLRSRENPLITPGLTLAQRLNYFASTLTYFDPYQKLIFLLTPAVIVLTGLLPLRARAADFLLHWIPFIGFSSLMNVIQGRGEYRLIEIERYNQLKLFIFLRATLQLLWPRRLVFQVTPKGSADHAAAIDRRLVWPNIVLLVLQAGAAVIGLVNLRWGLTARYDRGEIALMAIFWATINATLIVTGVAVIAQRLYRRQDYRFPVKIPAWSIVPGQSPQPVEVQDLSLRGARLISRTPLTSNQEAVVTFELPDGRIEIPSTVVHCRPGEAGTWQAGVRFGAIGEQARLRLIAFLFIAVPRIQHGDRPQDTATGSTSPRTAAGQVHSTS